MNLPNIKNVTQDNLSDSNIYRKGDTEVKVEDWGRISFADAWERQTAIMNQILSIKKEYFQSVEKAPTFHRIIFCEHNPVYTLGKSGDEKNLLLTPESREEKGIEYFHINRGGDITYHGPGQLVVYPILDLDYFFTDIGKFLRLLEETVIRTLAEFGIDSERFKGYTGVWLDVGQPQKERKICAIGIRCSRWVTMHGLALNVNTDLSYFNHIIPCGIENKLVTSIEAEKDETIPFDKVKGVFLHHFLELFEIEKSD